LRKTALVIDTHHLWVLALVGPKADFRHAYDDMMALLPREWSAADLDEHHQLMKRLGQTFCRPTVPRCRHCPSRDLCSAGRVDLDRRRATDIPLPRALEPEASMHTA